MYYCNDGTLTFHNLKAENRKDIIAKMEEYNIAEDRDMDFKTEETGDFVVDISNAYGDIEGGLIKLAEYCKSINASMECDIDYSGDYDGKYVCKDNELNTLSSDELIIQNTSTEELLRELERRGVKVEVKKE